MASKLDFGNVVFLGEGKSGISAGKIISHSREDGLLHRFFPLRTGPLQLLYLSHAKIRDTKLEILEIEGAYIIIDGGFANFLDFYS